MNATPVLIAGAGPTGLVLALSLARRGVSFRIIDEADGPGEHSRAMVVQARTLEFYQQFGFADELIAEGIVVPQLRMRVTDRGQRPREVLSLKFRDIGAGISPFPFALTYPQDDHEKFLGKKLDELGVRVEWNTRLAAMSPFDSAQGDNRGDNAAVTATIEGPGGNEEIAAQYLCGCDGAHSVVRTALGVGFAGTTYDQHFFVCDAKIAGDFITDLIFTLGEDTLVLILPVRSSGMHRLIGLVPAGVSNGESVTFDAIRDRIEPFLGIKVSEVNWFATYRVHHRVAEKFRVGPVFILGDAAHIHSPVGGQGMNTGIGDAVNLGWKLADAIRGRTARGVLDSFEEERIGFARALVETTDRAFTAIIARGERGELTRRVMLPLIMRFATRFAAVRHALFRIVSQTRIRYRHSSLSEGKAGAVLGGDRLLWVASLHNFAPLCSLDWQLHAYGQTGPNVGASCARLGVPVYSFPWNEDARRAGFPRDAMYLVRPDGYVGLALESDDAMRFDAYAGRIGLRAV
jgi:2-polyprenyl-6-methoxyphenol hydroxylase-like FAD-dependent oxidoreductase